MVVVPTLFTGEAAVKELLEKLEVHYLANQDEHLYFALLGDLADADAEETPADEALLDQALAGVEELNARYSADPSALKRFHLFQRRRLWNAREGKWMGWERKRGKLEEFNRLLRGARDTSFIIATAGAELLTKIRYVITLDSDTQLPRDAARRLVGIAEHPLNRAPAEPPAVRRAHRARRARLRDLTAARQRLAGERRALALRAHLLRQHRR
jgi:cyclic beta-1,2-glucan synthetase